MTQQTPPENYYLNYLLRMVEIVYDRYQDILCEEDLYFIEQLRDTSEPALRLLIRLYLRKGPNFLVDKLSYAEVPDINEAIEELIEQELLEENPEVFAYELIELLPIAQSRTTFANDKKIKKSDLVEQWLDDEDLKPCTEWDVDDRIITPLDYESYRRIQLLFFGNEHQDLTEFILEDLGLFKYESYPLDKANRLFESQQEIDELLKLNDLRNDFYLMNEIKDWSTIVDLTEACLELDLPERLQAKWHRLLNRIAYRLEQMGELSIAEKLFSTNDLPPSRERRVRILFKLEQFEAAHELLASIESQPMSAEEIQFYRRFVNKLRPKLALEKLALTKPGIETITMSWVRGEGSVEQQACEQIPGTVWLENSLPLSVFGLIYWPVIFADVPGVWHHPFQAAPTDLTDPEFIQRRKVFIDNIRTQSKSEWRKSIEKHWVEKENTRNPFVHWQKMTLDTVLDCFDALSRTQWQGLFDHLLSDIKHFRSGFPDLFQLTEDGYRFIEIKGPGDKLQDNQIVWLEKFAELNINAVVCYVSYLET